MDNPAQGEARTAWHVDFMDASGNRDRRQFPSKGEADAFRVEIEGQLRSGTFRADVSIGAGSSPSDRRAIETPLVDGLERVGDRSCGA